jgi:hypothetical protein
MSELNSPVDEWVTTQFLDITPQANNIWDPGFDSERRIVVTRMGPYQKVFLRPDKYIKRFYHTLYSITIAKWQLLDQIKLYEGFCTIDSELNIRFQASVKYAQSNVEILAGINEHIKSSFEGIVRDVIEKELLDLTDGTWIETGLTAVERQIETAVNEALMVKNVQCRTICTLKPSFQEFPDDDALDGRFSQESVYLNVLSKNFEFREKQARELQRQEEQLQAGKLQQQRKQMEMLNSEEQVKREKLAEQAENIKRSLLQQEQQLAEQHEIEARLHEVGLTHKNRLDEMEQLAKNERQEKQLENEQMMERKIQKEKRKQQVHLKEKRAEAEIEEFEKRQIMWNKARQREQHEKLQQKQRLKKQAMELDLKGQEVSRAEQHKIDERLQLAEIKHQREMSELKLSAEVEERKKRAATAEQTNEYLRKEIEMLVLEKQRAELSMAITQAKRGEN